MKNVLLNTTLLICFLICSFQNSNAQTKIQKQGLGINQLNVSNFTNNPDVASGFWSASEANGAICIQYMSANNKRNSAFIIESCITKEEFSKVRASSSNLEREAGTISFSGDLSQSGGNGTYQFSSNSAFTDYLNENSITDYEDYYLFIYFLANTNRDYIEGVKNEGYSPTGIELKKLAICGVPLEYINEISATNYDGLELNMVAKFYIHGVTKEYLSDLASAGYGEIDPVMVKKFAIHGVTKEYLADLASVGYGDIDPVMVKKFVIHGVDKGYINSLLSTNISKPDAVAIKKAKIHNLTANFIERAMRNGANTRELSAYTKLKIHGI